ncbi:MAG: FHA domain-containing protein [Myxococcales bacterium]|nr:FHA domain-containing protein [Myxococcales bacterium]
MDQSKKTMRHFYCRDFTWETFEKMANDFDCSIDYLINEGMRYYARSKNYQTSMAPHGGARPGNGRPTTNAPVAQSRDQQPTNPPPIPSRQAAPSRPPAPAPAPAPVGAGTLFLVFNNQRYPIAKDQFIIGRGSKTSDLPIKDGNISRKHAAVIRRNGTFYIKDLGSTNGIDYKGMRIDNKRIDEGDTFHICDYELRFSYR